MESAQGSDVQSVETFEFGVRLGIVLIVEAASLSALAVTSLLLYILYSVITLKRGASRTWKVSTHFHYYFVNLLVSDLIQAIGGIIDIKWALDAAVTEGTACTVQGMFKQMGDVGVAFTSLIIALHTFSVLVLRWHSGPKVALFVIATIWIFIALVVGVSMGVHRGETYYGNTQYWCWITSNFSEERIGLEYAWMWTAAFVNIVCYIAISLVLKGIMVIERRGIRVKIRWRKSGDVASAGLTQYETNSLHDDMKKANAMAIQMLFYPLIYLITVFPITLVRWLTFAGREVPFSATACAGILFSSSGVLNTILFVLTRPRLLPRRQKSDRNSLPLSTSVTLYSPQSRALDSELPPFNTARWEGSPELSPTQLPVLHIRASQAGSVSWSTTSSKTF